MNDLDDPQAQKDCLERDAVQTVRDKRHSRARAPRLKMEFDEDTRVNAICFDHDDQRLAATLAMHDFGSADIEFYKGLLEQIAGLGEPGSPVSEGASNFALSVIREVEPKDGLEAMLAAQMAATHMATMTFARRLNHVETIAQQDSAERAFNKLTRTFSTQLQTLKKYRSNAHQTVRVERVEVNEGGQAIVGNVSTEGRGDEKK